MSGKSGGGSPSHQCTRATDGQSAAIAMPLPPHNEVGLAVPSRPNTRSNAQGGAIGTSRPTFTEAAGFDPVADTSSRCHVSSARVGFLGAPAMACLDDFGGEFSDGFGRTIIKANMQRHDLTVTDTTGVPLSRPLWKTRNLGSRGGAEIAEKTGTGLFLRELRASARAFPPSALCPLSSAPCSLRPRRTP